MLSVIWYTEKGARKEKSCHQARRKGIRKDFAIEIAEGE